jgi:nucleoside-diphosphate-sugar epimerase
LGPAKETNNDVTKKFGKVMTKKNSTLITGAAGELGTAVLSKLADSSATIVAVDMNPEFRSPHKNVVTVQGDLRDRSLMRNLFEQYSFNSVYHFAALLSSAAEKNPFLAQEVNVEASSFLIQLSYELGKAKSSPVKFIFPSSMAIYGSPNPEDLKTSVKESQCLQPQTLYGVQKLYIEQLGTYLCKRSSSAFLDFRSLRYPGLISIETLPTGGTSDYAAEMLHSAFQGKPYSCFVSEHSRIPFMTMPDATRALLSLANFDSAKLTQRVYNVRGFAVSALELSAQVKKYFPTAQISFDPIEWRDQIVAFWPDDIDDSVAKRDWEWCPRHDLDSAFTDYFIPGLQK